MSDTRKCTLCLQVKSLEDFHNDKNQPNGKTARCKSCRCILANAERHDKRDGTWVSRAKPKLTKAQLRANANAYSRRRNSIKVFYTATNRARNYGAFIGKFTHKEIRKLYRGPCYYCNSTERISIDHVIPLALGGPHTIGNLVSACQSCNSSKKSKLFMVWKMSLGNVKLLIK